MKLSDKSETNSPNARHQEDWQGQDSLTKILFLPKRMITKKRPD
jgi:hypothetical protein